MQVFLRESLNSSDCVRPAQPTRRPGFRDSTSDRRRNSGRRCRADHGTRGKRQDDIRDAIRRAGARRRRELCRRRVRGISGRLSRLSEDAPRRPRRDDRLRSVGALTYLRPLDLSVDENARRNPRGGPACWSNSGGHRFALRLRGRPHPDIPRGFSRVVVSVGWRVDGNGSDRVDDG